MSNLSLERLAFDPAAVADGPSIGTYLISASGSVIDDTSGALDVYLANASIVVTATDLDIRDLDSSQDNVEIQTAAGQALAIDGSGYLTVNQGTSPWVVSATDLDIRDLTHVSDSIKVGDGVDFIAVNSDGSINCNMTDDNIADGAADSGNPLKVGGHAYDQASAWSAVDAGDRANIAQDLYRRQLVNDAPNVSASATAAEVVATEVLLGAAIAGRTRILIQNNGDKPVYVGPTGVGITTGLQVGKGSTLALELGESIDLYGIAATAGPHDVRILQLA